MSQGQEEEDEEISAGFVLRTLPTTALDQGTDLGKIATFNDVARGFLSGGSKLTVLHQTVYIGIVSESNFSEEKAQRFLEDLR